MAPADQRLDADHLGGAQVDVGLVEHEELVVLEGVDEVGVEGALVDGLASRRGVDHRARVHLEGVPTPALGPVHGLVGPAEQLVVGIAVVGGHGDADGGRGLHLLAEDHERACSCASSERWAS